MRDQRVVSDWGRQLPRLSTQNPEARTADSTCSLDSERHAVCLRRVRQAGAAGRDQPPLQHRKFTQEDVWPPRRRTKVKDLPRKAIDSKKAADVKGGMLAKSDKPSK